MGVFLLWVSAFTLLTGCSPLFHESKEQEKSRCDEEKKHVKAVESYDGFLNACSGGPEQERFLHAREVWQNRRLFSRNQAKRDLLFMVEQIENNHISALYGLPTAIKTQVEKEIATLPSRISLVELWRHLLSIASTLNCGHTTLYPPQFFDDYEFRVRYFIDENNHIWIYLNGRRYEVYSINGVKARQILCTAREFIPYDHGNDYGFRAAVLYYLTHPLYCDVLEIPCIDRIAQKIEQRIEFLEGAKRKTVSFVARKNAEWISEHDKFVYFEIDPTFHYAVLTLRACYYNKVYKRTLKHFFEYVQKYGIKRIALDLRDNRGGDGRVVTEFIKYLPCKAYKTYGSWDGHWARKNKCKVRLIRPPAQMFKNKRYSGLIFKGDVFMLTSSKTFSSGMWFAVITQDNHLAKIVGEPCGGRPTGFGDGVQSRLPNSKLIFQTTYKAFFRPNETKDGEPCLTVDFPIDPMTALDFVKNLS
jgi:hypothetical protein